LKSCFVCQNADVIPEDWGSRYEPPTPPEANCCHPLADQIDDMAFGECDCEECPFFAEIVVESCAYCDKTMNVPISESKYCIEIFPMELMHFCSSKCRDTFYEDNKDYI
jgi:hypothetical protein